MQRGKPVEVIIESDLVKAIEKGQLTSGDKIPSLLELAKKYNVATTTIHRALTKLRRRGYITTLAGKGSFVNDLSSVHRRRLRENCISFIYPNLAGRFISEIFRGIDKTISAENYYLASFDSLDDHVRERENLQKALEIKSKGILIFPVPHFQYATSNYDMYLEVQKRAVPLIFINNYPLHLNVDYVVFDDFDGVYQLTKHMIERGHKKIVFFGGFNNISSLRNRMRGFYQAMKDAGIEINPRFVFPNPNAHIGEDVKNYKHYIALSTKFLEGILNSDDLPTAVVAATVSPWHFEILRDSNLRIPEDISVGCLTFKAEEDTGSKLLPHIYTPLKLTQVEQPAFQIGEKAAEMLLEKIDRSTVEKQIHVSLPMHFSRGNSVKDIKKLVQRKGKSKVKT